MFAHKGIISNDYRGSGNAPNPVTLRERALQYSLRIFQDFRELERILDRHEDLIRKRWRKKNGAKKEDLLREAWPDMLPSHRPDLAAWLQVVASEAPGDSQEVRIRREALLWPHISLEDLKMARHMPLLLHFRGRYQPHEFIYSDLELARLGRASGLVPFTDNLPAYVMMFHDRTSEGAYGEMVAWSSDSEAKHALGTGAGMAVPDGLLALEIQSEIMSFCVSFCKTILHDLEDPTEGTIMPRLVEPAEEPGPYRSLKKKVMESPYRQPARLDLNRLLTLVQAERDDRENHIWSMRELPSYYAERMALNVDHSQMMLLDSVTHQPHHWSLEPGTPMLFPYAAHIEVVDSYVDLFLFDKLLKLIKALVSDYARHQNKVRPDNELPGELLESLKSFWYILDVLVDRYLKTLSRIICHSPPMRQYCLRDERAELEGYGSATTWVIPETHEHAAMQQLKPLLGLLIDRRTPTVLGLPIVVDALEHAIENDQSVSGLISPLVAERLTTLYSLSECVRQLRLFQPWSSRIAVSEDQEALETRLYPEKEAVKRFMMTPLHFPRMAELGNPTGKKFEYPEHRQYTEEVVQKLRKAERNLAAFWHGVGKFYRSEEDDPTGFVQILLVLDKNRTIWRTPEYVPPVRTLGRRDRAVDQEQPHNPWSLTLHNPAKEVTGSFTRRASAETGKKRRNSSIGRRQRDAPPQPEIIEGPLLEQRAELEPGQGEGGQVDAPLEVEQEVVPEARRIFALDKASLKVFRMIFHDPQDSEHPGEVPWREFLRAMAEVGFAVEKLHGSTWIFTPDEERVGANHPIQFHEPHGKQANNKVPISIARRMGRRLADHYGWSAETFKAK